MYFITYCYGMNLNHLAIFLAVAESGSIGGGAVRLHISQPAVSKQLKEFEHTLGLPLFDRLPKGVRLTAAGEQLLVFARRVAAAEGAAEQTLAELRGLHAGRLAIGASTTIGNYLLPALLAQCRQTWPGIEIALEIANTDVIQHKLLENSLDLGLTEGFVENDDAARRHLCHGPAGGYRCPRPSPGRACRAHPPATV